jgi:histone acetyltransferase MYST1
MDRWVSESEIKSVVTSPAVEPISTPTSTGRRVTRMEMRRSDSAQQRDEDTIHLDPTELALEKDHEEKTKVKNIGEIRIGSFVVQTWYYSPFPEEYRNLSKLYICAYCLKYMKKSKTLVKHKKECKVRHPPGTEIYRDGNLAMFEVDGANQKIYCQCLCLMAKLFLDHKTLYFDVEPFLFYFLFLLKTGEGYSVVGYFSKEKHSAEQFNLACIVTFTQYQKCGYGRFLFQFSYEISKLEQKNWFAGKAAE